MDKQKVPVTDSRRNKPFLCTMQRDANHIFDGFRSHPVWSPGDFFDMVTEQMFPPIDILEADTGVEVTAEVPGVKETDLDISVTNDRLVLKSEKSSDHEAKEDDYHLIERRFRNFRRQVLLGFVPEDGAAQATIANGVLKVSVAKPADARKSGRKVEISKA